MSTFKLPPPVSRPAAPSRRNAGVQKYRQHQRTKRNNASVSAIKPEEYEPQSIIQRNLIQDTDVVAQQQNIARLKATVRSNSNPLAGNTPNRRQVIQSWETNLASATVNTMEPNARVQSQLPSRSSIEGMHRNMLPSNTNNSSSTHSSAKIKNSARSNTTKRSPLQERDMNSPQRRKRPAKANKTSKSPKFRNAPKSVVANLQPSALIPPSTSKEIEELPTKVRSSFGRKNKSPIVGQEKSSHAAKVPPSSMKQNLSKTLGNAGKSDGHTFKNPWSGEVTEEFIVGTSTIQEDEHKKELDEITKFLQLDHDEVRSGFKRLYMCTITLNDPCLTFLQFNVNLQSFGKAFSDQ